MKYQVDEDGLKGYVVIDIPSKFTRLEYIDECNFSIKDGQIELGMSAVKPLKDLYLKAEKHIEKIDLKHESGKTFKTWDAAIRCGLCDSVTEKVAMAILSGSQLGEA